jgi:hypothetical protein
VTLLVFNASLAYFQEGCAQATLIYLKLRVALHASVRRNEAWTASCRVGDVKLLHTSLQWMERPLNEDHRGVGALVRDTGWSPAITLYRDHQRMPAPLPGVLCL